MRIHTTASRHPARCCASCHDYVVSISINSTQGVEPVQLYNDFDISWTHRSSLALTNADTPLMDGRLSCRAVYITLSDRCVLGAC